MRRARNWRGRTSLTSAASDTTPRRMPRVCVKGANPMDDPFNLRRFLDAQADDYARALTEIRSGRKRSHWTWYVFPQFDGLAHSATSKHYAIKSSAEALAYLA